MPEEELGERFEHEESIIKINDRVQEFLEPKIKESNEDLKKTKGFIEVKEKCKDIKKTLGEELTNDADYTDFARQLNQLVRTHKFFKGKALAESDIEN